MQIIKDILTILPEEYRKRLPYFFTISVFNSILDFISIAFLAPFILFIIDRSKFNDFLKTYFNLDFSRKYILIALAVFLSFYVFKNVLQTKIIKKQSQYLYNIGTELSKKLLEQFTFNNYVNYYKTDRGKLMRDFHTLPIIFVTNVLLPLYNLISETLIIVVIVVFALILNPFITIVAVVIVVLSAYFLLYLRKSSTLKFNQIINSSYKHTVSNLMNVLNGYLEIRSSGVERYHINKFHESNRSHNSTLAELSAFKQNNIRYLEVLIIFVISAFSMLILFNLTSSVNIIILSFFLSAIIKFIPSFNKILNSYLDIKSNRHTLDVLLGYDLKKEWSSRETLDFQHGIDLSQIGFEYLEGKTVLANVTLKILKGDFIAITGVSGCGKTTLLHIISGILPPSSGQIAVDNKVITSDHFLPFAALVPQEPFIFQGSLLENIVMQNDANIDRVFIENLISAMGLQSWYQNLPHGLDTQINIGGKTISGGQKQRIALIRALYSKPDVLLLDEPTSQLNEALEDQIFAYLKELTEQDKLTIVAVFHNDRQLAYSSKNYHMIQKRSE